MKALLLPLLPLLVAGAAAAQQRPEPIPAACQRAQDDGPAFTQDKRLCYEHLSAVGRYQEVIDLIEVKTLGRQDLEPQERFFLGSAHFGLSHRTGAHSLQCFHAVRSKGLLEDFLVERQNLFQSQHSLGTSDDMKYVELSVRTLEALGSVTGCEESSHTAASLERYGRRYAIERLQGLFYKTGEQDPLNTGFQAKLQQLNGQMRDFVSIASTLETRYGLNLVELDTGRQYLLAIKDRINAQFAREAVQVLSNPVGGDEFPSFVYDLAWSQQVLGDLQRQRQHFEGLLQGEIATLERAILGDIQEPMEEYAARKEKQVLEVRQLTEQLLLPTHFWGDVLAPEHKGVSALQTAVATPHSHLDVEELWTDGMKGFCLASRPRWYCKKGGTP